MDNSLIIGISGVILSAITFFIGMWASDRRHKANSSEQRIQNVVDSYQHLYVPRKAGGMSALLQSGVLLLNNDKEVRITCKRLDLINGFSPLSPHDIRLESVDLLAFFSVMRKHEISPLSTGCVNKVMNIMKGPRT